MATERHLDRLERLTNLVLALLDTSHPLTLRAITSMVAGYPEERGACRQAFERDKRALRELGIPIETEPVESDEQVGYRILPEAYYLSDPGLDEAERAALAFAVAAVRLEGGGGRDALAKLGAPRIPDLPPVAVLPSLPHLGPLREAIRDHAEVVFDYRGRRRRVAPYALAFRSGSWYLVADDVDLGERRTYRVDRLEAELEIGSPGAFEPPGELDPVASLSFHPFDPDAPEGTEVLLAVDAAEAQATRLLLGAAALEEAGERGTVRLRFVVGDEEAFVAFVAGLGSGGELLEPPHLRQAVIERLALLGGVRL
jgi:proteasome accessory factor B